MNDLTRLTLEFINAISAELQRELKEDPGSERCHNLSSCMIDFLNLINKLNNGGELGKSV